ncbi:MAG: division/cell wall cluster transcriptional repressor MraZ [Bacillota bacterium]
MFTGEYHHTLDGKGRVIIPSRLREGLGDRFVITRGLDHCLFVYPNSEWVRLEQKMKELSFTKRDSRAFVRLFFSGAMEVEADRQGRVLIPPNLREYAGIEKDIMFIGVSNRVEIWNETAWKEYFDHADENYEELAEKLEDIDL